MIAQLDLKDLTVVRKVTLNKINLLMIRLLLRKHFLKFIMHALVSCPNNPIPPCKTKIPPYNANIQVLIIVILLIHSVTVCDGNPCRNSAVCVNNDDGTFTCKCQHNYEGILCEKKGKVKNDYLY